MVQVSLKLNHLSLLKFTLPDSEPSKNATKEKIIVNKHNYFRFLIILFWNIKIIVIFQFLFLQKNN